MTVLLAVLIRIIHFSNFEIVDVKSKLEKVLETQEK